MEQNRFEELPSDGEEEEEEEDDEDDGGVSFDLPNNAAARARRPGGHDDLAYGDDYGRREEYELDDADDDEWILAMRAKEEELCERALRRIRRARLRGEANVHLTREELDALERRKARELATAQAEQSARAASTRAALPASTAPKSKKDAIPVSAGKSKAKLRPSDDDRRSDRSRGGTPEFTPPMSRANSGNYITRQTSVSPQALRNGGRVNSGGSSRNGSLMDANYYENGARVAPSSSRESLSRALPDDPDWTPRSRSSSSAHAYSTDPFAYQIGSTNGAYSTDRRRASGANSVSYANVRRVPASAVSAAAANGGTVRMPVSQLGTTVSDPKPGRSSASRVPEVIEISSDDEDEDESDESQQGVRLTEPPEQYTSSGKSAGARSAHQRRSGGRR